MDADRLFRENQYWRDLLVRVAQDLESIVARGACEPAELERLQRRAMRIRQRVHEGPPEG
jgi:hypothetical protein